MRREHKRFLVILTILALSAALTGWIEFSRKKLQIAEESFSFPFVFGDWQGEEIPVSTRTLEILESSFVIIRKYTNSKGEVVYFSGVFSSRNRKAIHPPEVCLTGGGVSARKGLVDLKIGNKNYKTNRLVILPRKENEPRQLIFYWYKAGGKLFSNFYAQQLQMSWNLVRMKSIKASDMALLRISTLQLNREDEEVLEERLRDFTKLLFDYLKL